MSKTTLNWCNCQIIMKKVQLRDDDKLTKRQNRWIKECDREDVRLSLSQKEVLCLEDIGLSVSTERRMPDMISRLIFWNPVRRRPLSTWHVGDHLKYDLRRLVSFASSFSYDAYCQMSTFASLRECTKSTLFATFDLLPGHFYGSIEHECVRTGICMD